MANCRTLRIYAAVLAILFIFPDLLTGCAGEPALQQEVTTEYLLTKAGFARWDVNQETPKRQALLNNLPKSKISTYKRNGEVYHVYPDENSGALYVGDAVAYQRYLAMAHGRKICERVDAQEGVHFWGCMQDLREGAIRRRGQ